MILNTRKTILGIERIDEFKEVFENKRIGLITNPTGMTGDFESSIAVLLKKTNLVALFSPEHGVRGSLQAGQKLTTYTDEETGLPVYSLYGATKKPTKEMMDELDMISIDIQDNGSRYYTFIYTMAYCMMACAEYDKEFVVFDRPNPINGYKVEGNILDVKYRSFVGYYPMVQRHGMTMGELALLFNKEYGINCKLHIIPMKNWERTMDFEETGLPWVIPTPNLPNISTAYVYNTTCIFEGTNVSEGRGTTTPFELVGAPWLKSEQLAEELNSYNLPGVYFRPQYYTPTFAKYAGELCGGVFVHVTNRETFNTVKTSWVMLHHIRTNYSEHFKINKPYVEGRPSLFEFEAGSDDIIHNSTSLEEQLRVVEEDSQRFAEIRKPYLIY